MTYEGAAHKPPVTILAVDIGGTKVAAGLVTLGAAATVAEKRRVPTPATEGAEAVVSAVIGLVKEILQGGARPDAIGIATAGVVDAPRGRITSATDLIAGWAGTPLADMVREATGLRTFVLGDVQAHGLAEHVYGVGAESGSTLLLGIGTGIGGAFCHDKGVHLGANGAAGHFGHISAPRASGRKCSCGRSGHLEAIASGPSISRSYEDLSGLSVDAKTVDDRAEDKDPHAAAAVLVAARATGEALGSLANAFDPDLIVLSGSVANSGDLWWDNVRDAFREESLPAVAHTPIEKGSLGGDAPLIGAALWAQNKLREQPGHHDQSRGIPNDN